MSMVDTWIKNGRVIDPARGIDEVRDVFIDNGRIVELPKETEIKAKLTVDASGCLVVPGLVDAHQHISYHAADWGMHPDLSTIPNGITTVADAGTSGSSNCLSLLDRLSQFTVKSRIFVNCSPLGQSTLEFSEPLRPNEWNARRMAAAFDRGGDRVQGLKIRISKGIVDSVEPLAAAKRMANELNTRVLVHPTNAPQPQGDLLNLLGENDIYCHLLQGNGHNILDENGKIIPELWAAKERGVVLDAAHGMANFNFDVAERAFDQGLRPDVISSDTTTTNVQRRPMYSLANIMSKFLLLGMSLSDVIACTTIHPAKVLHMDDQVGSLAPGYCGDVTLLKLTEGEYRFIDSQKNERIGKQLLQPQLVFADGQLMYRAADFFGC